MEYSGIEKSTRNLLVGIAYNLEETRIGFPFNTAQLSNILSTNRIFDALCSLGYQAARIPLSGSPEQIKAALATYSREDTLIFNNVDGCGSDPLGAAHLLQLIEEMGFRHTGSTAEVTALCTDKAAAKQKLLNKGIPTPAFQVFDRPTGEISVKFPVIVKPLFQDASIGIRLESVVHNPQALYQQITEVLEQYSPRALVEEFIPGREMAVAFLGDEFLAISEEDYSQIPDTSEHLITYNAKWDPQDYYYQHITLRCPAPLSDADQAIILGMMRKVIKVLGLRDYGRMDIRFYQHTPYFLDMNETPDLGADAGFYLSASQSGYSYEQMIQSLLNIALKRMDRK
jgi:D-alanine-D-alanine ligase